MGLIPSPIGRRCPAGANEGTGEASGYPPFVAASPRTLTPTPAPRPGPRLRRGRSKAHAPVARKPCLLAPQGEGFLSLLPSGEGRALTPDERRRSNTLRHDEHVATRQPK
ncbi:hypothetical protein XcyCFBP4188_12835 [Xanthomonas hortorum pv. cynarae]|nr:hypothetical protein XcyCFBP4188_12835 [Xanthomonas hortorum pv. cynarae]